MDGEKYFSCRVNMKQTIQELRQSLVDICQAERYKGSTAVVESVPYIPYIPENWNGVLVLAEAQNLSENLYEKHTDMQKISRLYPKTLHIGRTKFSTPAMR